ncbi:MAG: tryptophan synthase subunit alpha [Deinococcota bacterium]|nr:tryptophan synthase subunit alpha [Deinococcota bacterium]
MSRISRAFAQAKGEGRAAFIPYLTAGFPDKVGFFECARALLESADILEVGLPYSDPLGDGPTIQRASERALAQGTTTKDVLEAVRALRRDSDKALVVMSYYNPIYCYAGGGETGFVRDLKAAGADGVILPDLPPDEGEALTQAAREHDLDTVFLVAPTSTRARLELVTRACRGFVYAVSVTGVTGARGGASEGVPDLVRRVREVSDLPVAVGFGVSSAATARPVAEVADGVVVGSALIAAIDGGEDVAALAGEIALACRRGVPSDV